MERKLMECPELSGLVESYFQNKQSLDNYEKVTKEQNEQIKNIMIKNNINEFRTLRGLKATLSAQKRESFIDSKVIAKLKELNVLSPIKMVEVIDTNELENVIYNHQLDASELTDCKQVKEILVLKVKE